MEFNNDSFLFIFAKKTNRIMKGVIEMVLFTILLITLALLAAFVLVTAGVVGTATLVVFGDVIAFVLIIALIAKLIKRKKK